MRAQRDQLQSLSLAAILAVGAGVAWMLGLIFAYSLVRDFIPNLGFTGGEQLCVFEDGTPLIASYSAGRGPTYRTLEGKSTEIANPRDAEMPYLSGPEHCVSEFSRLNWRERLIRFQQRDGAIWYFVHDGQLHGRGCFVGYHNDTKLVIGYIGRSGFQPEEPALDEQFLVDGHRLSGYNRAIFHPGFEGGDWGGWYSPSGASLLYLLADNGLIQVDLKQRTVKMLRKDANLISAATLGKTSPFLLVRTTDRILTFYPGDKELRVQTYTLPAELRNLGLQWLELPNDRALIRTGQIGDRWGNELYWIDAAGTIVRHESVDIQNSMESVAKEVAAVAMVPSFGTIVGISSAKVWRHGPYVTVAGGILTGRELRRALVVTGLIGAVLAVFCYRRHRRYGLPWAWAWAAFVLLFGVPAYLGYLAHRLWPTRLPCPHCGQPAPRDRPACMWCGQDLPSPPPKGIEVFA